MIPKTHYSQNASYEILRLPRIKTRRVFFVHFFNVIYFLHFIIAEDDYLWGTSPAGAGNRIIILRSGTSRYSHVKLQMVGVSMPPLLNLDFWDFLVKANYNFTDALGISIFSGCFGVLTMSLLDQIGTVVYMVYVREFIYTFFMRACFSLQ